MQQLNASHLDDDDQIQVIWAKLTWRATAQHRFCHLGNQCTAFNKIILR